MCLLIDLQKPIEFFDGQSCLLKNVRKGSPFNGPVSGNSQFEGFCGGMLLQSDVASFLSYHDPSVSLKRPDNLIVG